MLAVHNCSVNINQQTILQDITFSLEQNQILSVIGPSGAGKSTILRCLAGFQQYTGTITLNRTDLATVPIHQRNIGLVEQQSTLLPHLTVFENIALPLQFRKLTKPEIIRKVTDLLQRFGIAVLAQRLPQQISGGEQQRVAIARALIYQPSLLLLDEPFGALDALWRYDLLTWLKTTLAEQPIPTLFVTHDQREARFISSDVLCLVNGQIAYTGTWVNITATQNQAVQQLLAKTL